MLLLYQTKFFGELCSDFLRWAHSYKNKNHSQYKVKIYVLKLNSANECGCSGIKYYHNILHSTVSSGNSNLDCLIT